MSIVHEYAFSSPFRPKPALTYCNYINVLYAFIVTFLLPDDPSVVRHSPGILTTTVRASVDSSGNCLHFTTAYI